MASQYKNDAIEIIEKEWIPVSERLPEKVGCYLCISSDGWQMVCFINAFGCWMLRPGGAYYGDLCGSDTSLGMGSQRVITHWRELPIATIRGVMINEMR